MAEATSWTLIEGAAGGDRAAQEQFGKHYLPIVRAFFAARWRDSNRGSEVEDGVQEVFVQCFRRGGVLNRVHRGLPGSFRKYLHGVARNVARKIEVRRGRRVREGVELQAPDELVGDELAGDSAFEQAWTLHLVREAAALQRFDARASGARAERRVELLDERFLRGKPIRTIAEEWGEKADWLHHEYEKAREEFRDCLSRVVALHEPSLSPREVQEECRRFSKYIS